MSNYDHISIEQKWQKFWEENKTFSVKNSPHPTSPTERGEEIKKPKFYALDMFPFPSGAGLHVGHPEGYTATDILCRKRRMEGYDVLHPMGWDAFGLPAENFAIKSKIHPEISTNKNIENFTRQIKSLGFSYDWDREISTTDTDYYKWTQDLFLKFYEKGLLYEDDKPMNWCPSCKVICANEEVEQGMHERCGNAVSKKSLKQWMFKITEYAERLLQDLETPNVILLHGLGGNGESGWTADIKKYFDTQNIPAFSPTFPNSDKPEYSAWKKFFEANLLDKITPQTIIIGHSLGCGFMQRYLSEENLNVKFSELIFVAPTISDCKIPEISNFFEKERDTEKKRGCVPYGCCSNDNLAKPSQSGSIFSHLLIKVKKKTFKKTKKLDQVKSVIQNNKTSIIFDGEILFSHFLSKPYKERNFRQNWALTVIKSLSQVTIENNIAYIESQNQIFKIVFSHIDEKTSQVKTFYRSEKLTREYHQYLQETDAKKLKKKIIFDYQKISESVENIFVYAGGKDPYIKTEEFNFLAEKLSAQLIFDKNQEHYWGDSPLKNFPEISEKCEKISASTLEWPHKIKAMQKNWIGKSSGLLFTSPLITQYIKTYTQKKRGTKGAHPRKENSSDSIRFSRIGKIIFSKLVNVNKKKYNNKIENIQEILTINNQQITFDGFALLEHWKEKKNDREIKDRIENAVTVIKALTSLWYETEDIAYFISGKNIFRVVFDSTDLGEKRVKTYYKVNNLSQKYQHAKKTNTLEIQTYNSHFEAFKADTFFVIAPDHALLSEFLEGVKNKSEILAECKAIVSRRDARGFEEEKESEGIFTGRYIQDPVGNGKLPLWVASYALADYGTGIVKCSCHDERDFAFAKKYNISMKPVLFPENSEEAEKVSNLEYCFSDMKSGILAEPAEFSGKKAGEMRKQIAEYAEEKNLAKEETNYKLRDWIFTRQRYWGEPIPLVFDENGKCYPLDTSELPVLLPDTPNYEPSASGESPLAKIEDWVNVRGDVQKNGKVILSKNGKFKFRRETSTMPNWAGSSWYWLRFMDSKNDDQAWSSESEKAWGSVDLYVGGAEHAVLHLLYARFWHKALFDMGLVSTKEPFKKLVNQGMILSYAFEKQTAGGGLVAVDEVTENPENSGHYFWKNPETGETQEVKKITAKMSKSLKNVVNPDDIVEKFGADTLRMYEMFMGPFEQSKEWNTKAVEGMHRFLAKIHRYFSEKEISDSCPSKALISLTHKTVKKVSQDIEDFKFNTAISQMMVWMNEFSKLDTIPKISGGKFVRLLAPFAPHLAEELWKKFKPESETLTFESWPTYKEELTVDSEMTYGVQVNGKVRGELTISKDAGKNECLEKAKKLEKVAKFIEGLGGEEKIRKEIFVPGKIIGFVVK